MSGPPDTRRGYDAREVVSALQKAVRRSDVDACLYWGLELAQSGYGAWLWARLRTIAVEDVSPTATGLVADLHALGEQWAADQRKGRDGNMLVTRALIALAAAPKSRIACWGLLHHASDHVERREVPDEALDMHTARGRRMGRSLDPHFMHEASKLIEFDGDLADLETGYAEAFRREQSGDPDLPLNGWGGQPAQNSHTKPSGQLPLDVDR